MASIKKRANGTFQAAIYVGRDADGRQLFEYVTRDTEKEVRAEARRIETELYEKRLTNKGRMKLKAWTEEWINLNRSRLAPATIITYKSHIKNSILPFLGDIRLDKITELQVERLRAHLSDKFPGTAPNAVMTLLKRILYDALKDRSPARDVKVPPKSKYRVHLLTPEEFEQIWNTLKGGRDELIFLLAAWCGLRVGEIAALNWDDVDWQAGEIRVDETISRLEDGGTAPKDPKSERGFRRVVVPDYVMSLLREWRKAPQKRRRASTGLSVFGIGPGYCSRRWSDLVKLHGFPKVHFHDLRHYHVSYLYEHDVPDQYAAQRMGHDIATMKSVYQHLGLGMKERQDEKIRQLYPNPAASRA